jgi:hypothetical protein
LTQPDVARRATLKGLVEHRHEADALISEPGDAAIVERGVLRALVMACPDGCGERLTVNLDRRAGPAWRLYRRGHGLTLFPSVWRESGCRCHFVLWNNRILWADHRVDPADEPEGAGPGLAQRILAAATIEFKAYAALAFELDEVPWEVARTCRRLVRSGQLRAGSGKKHDHFALP